MTVLDDMIDYVESALTSKTIDDARTELCMLRMERDKFKQRLLDLGVDPETGKRIPEGCIASDALDTFQEFAIKHSGDDDAAHVLMSCLRNECEHYGTNECELCGDELK